MGFPILRLPFLALKGIVDHFDGVELVTVSLLNKRADRILKACGKKNISFFNLEGSVMGYLRKSRLLELFLLESNRQGELPEWSFNLRYSVSRDLHISITCRNFIVSLYFETLEDFEKLKGVRRNLKIGATFVPVVITKEKYRVEEIRTILSSKTDGLVAFMQFFKHNSNLPIDELRLAGKDTNAIRTVVNCINSTQTVVRNVLVSSYSPLSENDFKFVLENVWATERFSSESKLSQNFKFDGTIRAKNVGIQNGHWFTIQNLLASEIESIYVNGSDYSKEELRMFLKEWKEGKLPKLKQVNLATGVSCWDVIEGYERWEGRCRTCKSCYDSIVTIKLHGDCHGCVHTSDWNSYVMSIHDNPY